MCKSDIACCLWYCKSTIFQANHNDIEGMSTPILLFVILQKYDFSSKSQLLSWMASQLHAVCDTAKVRFFKQITTGSPSLPELNSLFVILQKYDFSSKSQRKSGCSSPLAAVCDTAKVRFFKQITTSTNVQWIRFLLFVILQKYDFSSKSQQLRLKPLAVLRCLWYCKSTIFQANHNKNCSAIKTSMAVCDTAKVRFFKQITTYLLKKYDLTCCLWYCKSTIFQANHNPCAATQITWPLFVILQKYDFSSKSQPPFSYSV